MSEADRHPSHPHVLARARQYAALPEQGVNCPKRKRAGLPWERAKECAGDRHTGLETRGSEGGAQLPGALREDSVTEEGVWSAL